MQGLSKAESVTLSVRLTGVFQCEVVRIYWSHRSQISQGQEADSLARMKTKSICLQYGSWRRQAKGTRFILVSKGEGAASILVSNGEGGRQLWAHLRSCPLEFCCPSTWSPLCDEWHVYHDGVLATLRSSAWRKARNVRPRGSASVRQSAVRFTVGSVCDERMPLNPGNVNFWLILKSHLHPSYRWRLKAVCIRHVKIRPNCHSPLLVHWAFQK